MSSSNNPLLLSILLAGCAGVERAELPTKEPLPEPLQADPATLSNMAEELDRREAYLQSARDNTVSVATAVLNEIEGSSESPALGMAVIELTAGGMGLRIAAELEAGIHHVYVLEEPMTCGDVDLVKRQLIGSPSEGRPDYLGSIESLRKGAVRFQRHVPDGVPYYHQVVGRPLVLVHSRGESVVCGVFKETGARMNEAVSTR